MEIIQDFCRFLRQLGQAATFDRLHNQHRFSKSLADLVASPALNGRILIIQVVELQLHHLDLRVFR